MRLILSIDNRIVSDEYAPTDHSALMKKKREKKCLGTDYL